jgi:hypothetical protein
MELSEPALITAGGFVFQNDSVAPLDRDTPFDWLNWLRGHGMLEAPEQDRDQLLSYLLTTPGLPAVDIPEELKFEEAHIAPKPRLRLRGPSSGGDGTVRLMGARLGIVVSLPG